MSRSPSEISAELANLRGILGSGVVQGSVDGQAATFMSPDELRQTIRDLEQEQACALQMESRKPRVASIRMTRGVV